jgi:hypothetical protein
MSHRTEEWAKKWSVTDDAHSAATVFIMVSSLTEALAQHAVDSLRKMVESARENVQRAQFEVAIIEEALSSAEGRSKATRPQSSSPPQNGKPASSQLSPAEKRELVFLTLQELGPEPVPPRVIAAAIDDESVNVYNALGQLKKVGKVQYHPEDGLYSLPTPSTPDKQSSANGHDPGGLKAGTQLSGHPTL